MNQFNQNNPYGTPYQPPLPQQNGTGGVFFQPNGATQANLADYAMAQEKRRREKSEILSAGFALGGALVACLLLQVVGVACLQAMGYYDDFSESFLFQHATNILLVDGIGLVLPFALLALLMKNRFVTPVVPRSSVRFAVGFSWVGVGLCACLGANIVTNGVISVFKQFGYELTQYETLKPNHPLECALLVVSTAIAPAVCEEFAMRCVSLGILRRHGKPFAVVAVSIVFGLLHGNVIQFVFAFLIGLALAYITIVTDSVVPAMFVHGLNNGLSVTSDILKYASTEKIADYVLSAVMVAILIAGIGGLIYLLCTKQFLPKKDAQEQTAHPLNFGTKFALLMPGMIVPFIILVVLTVQTIKPIS